MIPGSNGTPPIRRRTRPRIDRRHHHVDGVHGEAQVHQPGAHRRLTGREESAWQGHLSELIQVSFVDRFAKRKLERQFADIADSVESAGRADHCGIRRDGGS